MAPSRDGRRTLVIGATGCGKTSLVLRWAARALDGGRPVLVSDPLSDPRWPAGVEQLDGAAALLARMQALARHRPLAVLDESGGQIDRYIDDGTWPLATMARRWGDVVFIAQRAQQLPLTVRCQCDMLAAFRLGRADARLLAEEWASDAWLAVADLPRRAYLIGDRFGTVERKDLRPWPAWE